MLQLLLLRALTPERLHSSILLHTSPPAGLTEGPGMRARARFLPRSTTSSALPTTSALSLNASAAPPPVARTGASSPTVSDAGGGKDDSTGTASVGDRGGGASFGAGEAGPDEELRCVVAVIRHGDRTPKQKMKMLVSDPGFLSLHKQYAKNPKEEAKLKSAQQLQCVLEVTRRLVAAQPESGAKPPQPPPSTAESAAIEGVLLDDTERLLQMKAVLEKGGHFDGGCSY
jgi:hypothetical protein